MEIKEGPELDRAVAEAIGLLWTGPYGSRRGGGQKFCWPGETVPPRYVDVGGTWSPSTDLNAAFEAADKVGLFDKNKHDAILGKTSSGQWEIVWGTDDEDTVTAPSPALAICAALLELKEKVDP